MSRNKILLVAVLMVGLAAKVVGDSFTVDLLLDKAIDKSLTFGMVEEDDYDKNKAMAPLPQFTPWIKTVYLEGPGEANDAIVGELFDELSVYMKKSANAALWKLCVENLDNQQTVTITFKVTEALPNGSILKVYPENDDEGETIVVENETAVLNAKANTIYLIDYRKSENTPAALLAPPVKKTQMSIADENKPMVIDFDVPDGYSLGAEAAVKAFKSVVGKDEKGDDYIYYEALEGDRGSFDVATSTLTMTNMADVARIQFNYWFTDGENKTEEAVVIVDVTLGLKTTLVKKTDAAGNLITGAVVAVNPSAEEYDGTILTYKIDFDDAMKGQELTYGITDMIHTPDKAPYSIGYAFSDAEALGDDVEFTALAWHETEYDDAGNKTREEGYDTFVYTNEDQDTKYLHIKVTLTGNSESNTVAPVITVAENASVEMDPVRFIKLGEEGTLDIDGNGSITVEDAIMMYNFIGNGGNIFPDEMFVEDIIQGVDETQVDAEAALAMLKTLAPFLDFDESGAITVEDAIMMYNFVGNGGTIFPDEMFVDDIIQGIDASLVDAEKALENFKKLASK